MTRIRERERQSEKKKRERQIVRQTKRDKQRQTKGQKHSLTDRLSDTDCHRTDQHKQKQTGKAQIDIDKERQTMKENEKKDEKILFLTSLYMLIRHVYRLLQDFF